MRPLRATVRVRLTALYALLFCATVGVLLGASYWLLERHFDRTLSDRPRGDALNAVALQYVLAFAGTRDPGAGRWAGSSPGARWRRSAA